VCDQITGDQFCLPQTESIVPYCPPEEQTTLQCLLENNCSYYYTAGLGLNGDSLPPNSCAAENCQSSFKKVASCGCTNANNLYGNCFYLEYCSGFPVWGMVVIAIVVVILVLVVIAIVMVMRRKRTYEIIAYNQMEGVEV
jgi:hypothetical protein